MEEDVRVPETEGEVEVDCMPPWEIFDGMANEEVVVGGEETADGVDGAGMTVLGEGVGGGRGRGGKCSAACDNMGPCSPDVHCMCEQLEQLSPLGFPLINGSPQGQVLTCIPRN